MPRIRWTREMLEQSAANYKSLSEWREADQKAYAVSVTRSDHAEITAHLKKQTRVKWTKAKVIESAKKYHSKSEWYKSDNKAYNAAKTNGWLDEVASHMARRHQSWTKEKPSARFKRQ